MFDQKTSFIKKYFLPVEIQTPNAGGIAWTSAKHQDALGGISVAGDRQSRQKSLKRDKKSC